MRFVAIIPARYASTRFEGKPLSLIGGRSMIERVYERAHSVFTDCYVATDDSRIQAEVARFGGQCIMTDPNHQSGTDRVREALDKIGRPFDVVVNIQGDEPFIATEQLHDIRQLFSDPQCDIATIITPFKDEDIFNANAVKAVVSSAGYALYFSRSPIPFMRGVDTAEWASRHTYYKHIGLYGYRVDVLRQITKMAVSELEKCESLEQLRWLQGGYRIKTAVSQMASYGIDTPEDLKKVEKMFANQ